jgi:hypothetical protein
VSITRESLRIEVSDQGSWESMDSLSSINNEGGRGLQLVDAVSDRWGVDRRPNTVTWFEIDSN